VEGLGSGEDRAAVLEFNSAVSTLKQGNRRWGSVDSVGGNEGHGVALRFLGSMVCRRVNSSGMGQSRRPAALLIGRTGGGR
jgi:hypothetical protein